MNYYDWVKQYYKKDLAFKSYIKTPEKYLIPENSRIRYVLNNDQLNTEKNRNFIKEASMFFYYKMIEEVEDIVHEDFIDVDVLDEKDKAWVAQKKSIYDPLLTEEIPGATPLIQACYLLEALIESQNAQGNASKSVKEETDGKDVQQAVELIRQGLDKLEDEEIQELVKSNTQENFVPKKMRFKLLNTVSLLAKLGAEFKIEKEIEEEEVLGGTIPNTILMKRYEQLFQIPAIQFLYPNFKVNLATKNLLVDIYTEKTEHIQKIIILIDNFKLS